MRKADLVKVRNAVACLVNAERKKRHLRTYRQNFRLRRAALSHSRDMVRRSYFDHKSPGGSTADRRIKRSGYMRKGSRWSVGEALAWGNGDEASPKRLVAALMASKHHRDLILDKGFRELGIGVTLGAPVTREGGLPALTLALEFGVTKRVSRRR